MKNSSWIEERDQNRGFLFCLADQLALRASRASRGCVPISKTRSVSSTTDSYEMWETVSEKWEEQVSFPSVVDLFICLWWVKASPPDVQLHMPLKIYCSFMPVLVIFLFYLFIYYLFSCLHHMYRQWLPGYLQILCQKALRLTSGGLFLSSSFLCSQFLGISRCLHLCNGGKIYYFFFLVGSPSMEGHNFNWSN